ncbi:dihydrofolate reductase family protein [Puniceicoccaceae bacterium K14]|nr:dihydrofolate reductase family protein [Puniceicoccaceae bacterium K14]
MEGTSFCSKEDFQFFVHALKEFDCMIMGRLTYNLNKSAIQKGIQLKRLRKIVTHDPDKWTHETVTNCIEFSNATPQDLINELENRGFERCALLGGTQIYSEYLSANLIDELWLTLEPRLFGSGKPLATGEIDLSFKLKSLEKLSEDTALLKYSRA